MTRANIKKGYIIIGVDKTNDTKKFHLMQFSKQGDGLNDWEFNQGKVDEDQMARVIASTKNAEGTFVLNAKLVNGKVVGSTGSLDRFDASGQQSVIISAIVSNSGELKGYKVANREKGVKNVAAKDLISHCNRMSKSYPNRAPIQNAQFVAAQGGKEAFIRSYPDGDFIQEILVTKKNPHAAPAKPDTATAAKNVNKLDELFTKEQIKQLGLGKKHGVNIRIYGNPALSAEQMRVIRGILEDGNNGKLVADPAFKVKALELYRVEMRNNKRISEIINPAYEPEQVLQLSLGQIAGVDIAVYSDPKYNANQMAEIRMRLEKNIWSHSFDIKDYQGQ